MPSPRPVLLLILDGFGHREEAEHNAIAAAKAPHWRALKATFPHTLLTTSGEAVGLPPGQMGNSEVGHMNIGAGRVVYQELTRIDRAIVTGDFDNNPVLCASVDAAVAGNGTLHLLGLLSPGGVHSHEDQIFAMAELAARRGVRRIALHAFLDGRDTPPRSAEASLRRAEALAERLPALRVASLCGRYYAMDRDGRWERLQRAWQLLVAGEAPFSASDGPTGLADAYARDEGDEFVQPTVIDPDCQIRDGDAVVFMNFRGDRARQLCQAFLLDDFDGFPRPQRPRLVAFACLTQYQEDLPAPVAYPPEQYRNGLGEYLAHLGMTQLRIAETEKYAHVTFFFSLGREQPFAGEQRILVPSPKVATYDMQPEMSAPEVTDRLVAAIRSGAYDFIVCNLANCDMVGHTGQFAAAVLAVEAVDQALGRVDEALRAVGGELLVTADHGNLELMMDVDNGQPHTAHTTGPVPLLYRGRAARFREGGALKDIAPTVLALMGLAQPPEMSGESLITLLPEVDRSVG